MNVSLKGMKVHKQRLRKDGNILSEISFEIGRNFVITIGL